MANATFTTRSKLNSKGREKWYVELNLEGHKTSRFGGYSEGEAHKKGIRLVADYTSDPAAFFNRSKLKGAGIEPIIAEFCSRPVSDDTNELNEQHMEAFVEDCNISDIRQIDKYALLKQKKLMKAAGNADGYISMRMRIIRAFINFCLHKKYLKEDPWPSRTEQQGSGAPIVPTYRSKGYYYTDEEQAKLLSLSASPSDAQRFLNLAIKLSLFQGWREEHVWSFTIDRVNFERGTYSLYGIKGAQDREVPLLPTTLDMIKSLRGPGRVFKCWGDKEAISLAFRRYRKSLGIKRGRFHDLKHTCISKLFEAGWSVPEVEAFTNTSAAALKFYTHVNKKVLEQKVAKYNPVASAYPVIELKVG